MIITGKKRGQFISQDIRGLLFIAVLLGALALMFVWPQDKYGKSLEKDILTIMECDAEDSNGKVFKTSLGKVYGGGTQSDEQSHSETYSSKINTGEEYGMTFHLENPRPGGAYRATVWMYRPGTGRGGLVASDNEAIFFQRTELPAIKEDSGWEQLKLHFIIPKDGIDLIKLYTYKPKEEAPIYFDDLLVEEIQHYLLPGGGLTENQSLRISLPAESFEKLKNKEKEARQKSILITEESDWVDAFIIEKDENEIAANVRLKGDYLDHLENNKWSLRAKVKGENTWRRMKTFSLQSPHTRSYLNEWVYHQMLSDAGVLSPKYEFISVSVDYLKDGIYAMEEHFDKHLVESKNRREGPILKMAEDGFWLGYKRQMDFYGDKMLGERMDNSFWKSDIRPFKENRLLADSNLLQQYEVAQNLLFSYKYQDKKVSEVFDVERLANLYVAMDLNNAYHNKAWHNQRFYYNPVMSLLEPIGYDGFGIRPIAGPVPFLGYYFNPEKDFISFEERVFLDPDFFRAYNRSLYHWSNPDTIQLFFARHETAIRENLDLLRTEYPNYQFDREMIIDKARKIQALIRPYDDISLLVRTKGKDPSERTVEIYNKHCLPLEVIGYGLNKNEMASRISPPVYVAQQVKNSTPKAATTTIPTYAKVVFFRLAGTNQAYTSAVSELPGFATDTPMDMVREATNTSGLSFIREADDQVTIISGDHTLSRSITIGEGKQLFIEPGTSINLINGAHIISYSPVLARGSIDNPIRISSEDQTGQGLVVLQAKGTSKLEYVSFENLDALQLQGWVLTGAVTFYESNVDIRDCEIAQNVCEDGLNIIRSTFDIEGLFIHHTASDGFDADFCNGEIRNSKFSYTGNDGIDFSGSTVSVKNVQIDHAGDKGISVGEESFVAAWDIDVVESNIGVASKDLSEFTIHSIELTECNTGYAVYQKKPEFGPAKMIVIQEENTGLKFPMMIQRGSSIQIGEKVIHGKEGFEL